MECTGDPVVWVDRELLLKALETLFQNSRDAMPDGGTFTVAVRRKGNVAVNIVVSDTGTGIEEDILSEIFAPFFTRGRSHAAGLGLSIARKIVELHNGTISASNRVPGPGAELTITLPVD
jgi:signal transduction histidine kinase